MWLIVLVKEHTWAIQYLACSQVLSSRLFPVCAFHQVELKLNWRQYFGGYSSRVAAIFCTKPMIFGCVLRNGWCQIYLFSPAIYFDAFIPKYCRGAGCWTLPVRPIRLIAMKHETCRVSGFIHACTGRHKLKILLLARSQISLLMITSGAVLSMTVFHLSSQPSIR